jgi:hypothetical protein
MIKRKLDFVLFDMIGTTIRDSSNGDSLIIESFRKAFSLNGFQVSPEVLNQHRGKSKEKYKPDYIFSDIREIITII